MSVDIDIISDVVCPWCFIGKRHLEQALALYRERYPDRPQPQVHWHPFQLNPHIPASGMPRSEYTAQKFGGPEQVRQIYDRVAAFGEKAGISFDFGNIKTQPNTVDAHRLVHHAESLGLQDQMVESIFRGYFLEGSDLTSIDTLADLAERAGIPRDQAMRYVQSDEDRDFISKEDHHARSIGVEGVPFFVFNQKLAAAGAQPPEVLLDVIERVDAESEERAAVQ